MDSILWSHLKESIDVSPNKALSFGIECRVKVVRQVMNWFTGISEYLFLFIDVLEVLRLIGVS
jgi:hypothetical protein